MGIPFFYYIYLIIKKIDIFVFTYYYKYLFAIKIYNGTHDSFTFIKIIKYSNI